MSKKTVKRVALLLAAVLLLALAGCGSSGSTKTPEYPTPEKPITIKWGLSVSTANQAYINAQVVADHVKEATNGAVIVELCPNSQLGNEAAMWEGILSGTIDMANVSTGTLANTIPEFECFTLPFVFKNAETFWNVVAQDEFRNKFSELASQSGAVYVGIASMFTRGIATNKPVTLPEDLAGMKLRIMGGHTYADMFASWGVGTTTMAFNEVYTGLQQGVIDGLCVDLGGAVDQKFFEQCKYFVDTYHGFHCSPGMMRASLWNSLSPEQQQAFSDGYRLVAEQAVETYYADRANMEQTAVNDMGVTVTHLTPEQRQVWIDAVEWMYKDYQYIDSDLEAWFINYINENTVESDRF